MDLKEFSIFHSKNNYSRHPWERARAKFIIYLIKEYIPMMRERRLTILDIGCGDCFIREKLEKSIKKINYIGVDPALSEEAITADTNEYSNIHLYRSLNVAEQLAHIYKADIVLLIDVLEHISKDRIFLETVNNSPLINNYTHFVITAPAFNLLYSFHDKFLGHYRRYNNREIIDILEKNGLSIIDYGYFFWSLLLPRFLSSMFQRFKKTPMQGIGGYKANMIIDYLYYHFLLFDIELSKMLKKLDINLIGLSNYVICKRHV